MSANQNPEQIARDAIDAQLRAAGWIVQDKNAINFNAGRGIAVREFSTDTGPSDYMLFLDGQPVGVIEAKKETLGHIVRNEREIDGELRQSEALRQAILQKTFTGRLVPQVATDKLASALLARVRTEREAATTRAPRRVSNPA